jgi:serine/threonine protein kinase
MDAFRKRATETSELHASDPGAGAGKSRLLIEISSSRPDDMVGTETPRAALTSLSFILRNLGVFQAVLIGRGKFSEVYSGRDAEGRANGHAIKVAKDAASLVSIKEGQAGTEAYALHLGAMYSKSGGSSPFLSSSILMAVPAAGGQYVAVLLMDEAKGTATEVVKMLAEGIKSDGSFSQPGLEMARDFVRAVLERLFPLHFLLIAHRDLKPANLLMKGVNVFLADPAFAMFPTSRHIPVPSPGASPPTPKRTPQLGSGRAQSMLLRATGGTDLQRSPPANQTPRAIVEIKPSELETIFSKQFRLRNNSGTHVFTGPEFPYNRDIGTMMSSDFLPGDMWAVGIIMLQILSRDTAPWTSEQMEKAAMANSSQQDFWLKYLRCSGPPSADPVVLRAIDLVSGLLRADPAERLTCSAALAHPFLHRQ